jgi:toxin ParE1/3/4
LIQQLEFISQDKPSAADRMAAAVDDSVKMLARWPELGKPGPGLRYRQLAIPRTPFLVIYSLQDETVRVLRLLHGAQNRQS